MSKNNKSENDLACTIKEHEKQTTTNVQNKNIILSKSVPSSPIPIPQNINKKICCYYEDKNSLEEIIVGSFKKNKKIPIKLQIKPTKHQLEEDSSDSSDNNLKSHDSFENELFGEFQIDD